MNKILSTVLVLFCFTACVLPIHAQNSYYSSIKDAFSEAKYKRVIDLYYKFSNDEDQEVTGNEGYAISLYLAQSLCFENDQEQAKMIFGFIEEEYAKGLSGQQKIDIKKLSENCAPTNSNKANANLYTLFRDVAIADASISIGRSNGKNADFILYGAEYETKISKSTRQTGANISKPLKLFPVDQSEKALAYYKMQHNGEKVQFATSKYFVVTSYFPMSPDRLNKLAKELDAFYDILLAEYDLISIPYKVSITIAEDRSRMQSLAASMYGIVEVGNTMGLSMMDSFSMLCMIPKDPYRYRGTIRHELTHLLLNYKQPFLPPWLAEGLPSLYEATETNQKTGITNWRGQIVSTVLERGRDRDFNFESFLMADWDSFNGKSEDEEFIIINNIKQSTNYAMARYYLLYLQQTQQLEGLYKSATRPTNLLAQTINNNQENLTKTITNSGSLNWNSFKAWLPQKLSPSSDKELKKEVQRKLKESSFYEGSIDGDFGVKSKIALKQYQERNKLEATGEIDQATLMNLGIVRDSGNK